MSDELIPVGQKEADAAEWAIDFAANKIVLHMVVIPAAIAASQGFLGLPVIKQLFTAGAEWLMGFGARAGIRLATRAIIDGLVDAEKGEATKARDELKAELTKPVQDAAAKARAWEEFKKRYEDLIALARPAARK